VSDARSATGTRPRLSLTEYALLGLLTFGPASGYELDRLAARSIDYFWRPAKSKIYAVLPRLVEQGLAEGRHQEQQGRPDKQVYSLTDAGRRALRDWLDEEEPPPTVVRSGPLLKLFFGAEADEALVRRSLERWRGRAESQLAALRAIEAGIDVGADFFPYLTLLHGIAAAESTVTWATEAIARLDRRSDSGGDAPDGTPPPAVD
jgi:PadR family transcriptional regulator AphA